jgi:hypothetical protein
MVVKFKLRKEPSLRKRKDHVRHPHHVGKEAAAAVYVDQAGGASCWGSGIYTNLQLD